MPAYAAGSAENLPDLTVTALTWSPEEPGIGTEVTFTATVRNRGSGASGATVLEGYLDDGLLLTLPLKALPPGATATEKFRWKAAAGDHAVRIVLDGSQAVPESDEDNNTGTYALSVLAPDLIVSGIDWSPAESSVGGRVDFTVTVQNQGSLAARLSRVYFSIDGASRGYCEISRVPAGATANVTFSWVALVGSHSLTAIADGFGQVAESDESNNTGTAAYTTLAPDFIVDAITWSPAEPEEGDEVTVTVKLKNQGGGNALASHVSYYLDDQFYANEYVAPLRAGATSTRTLTLDAAARPQVIRVIADAAKEVAEIDETNNEKTAALPSLAPDLAVSSISWSPETPLAAHHVTFTVTVINRGKWLSTPSLLHFFIDEEMRTVHIGDLEAGASENATFAWTALKGTHTLRAVADGGDYVVESNEANNTTSVKLVSAELAAADLRVSGISWSPPSPAVGDEVTFIVSVRNQGSGQSAWTNLDFSLDSGFHDTALLSPIVPGGEGSVMFIWKAQPGKQRVTAVADTEERLAESNEDNNTGTVDISVAAPDLAITDLRWEPADPAPGDEVSLTVTISNRGSYRAAPSYGSYFLDDAPRGRHYIEALVPGAEVTRIFSWTAPPGPAVFRSVLDAEESITELDEENNVVVVRFPGYDLLIDDVSWSPKEPEEGTRVVFRVRVGNGGQGDSPPSVLSFYLGDTLADSRKLPALVPGGQVAVEFSWNAVPGVHQARAVVNGDTPYFERDLADNTRTVALLANAAPAEVVSTESPAVTVEDNKEAALPIEPGVIFEVENDKVVVGQDVVLRLYLQNPSPEVLMLVEVALDVPLALGSPAAPFLRDGNGQFRTTLKLEPGEVRAEEVYLTAIQSGVYQVNGKILAYFTGEKSGAQPQEISLPVIVAGGMLDKAASMLTGLLPDKAANFLIGLLPDQLEQYGKFLPWGGGLLVAVIVFLLVRTVRRRNTKDGAEPGGEAGAVKPA
ncbi:MAG: CARDB domain-containing protein [Chloroflexota bacterium]